MLLLLPTARSDWHAVVCAPMQGPSKQRSLQQNFAQFSQLQDQSESFGDAGGTWTSDIPGQQRTQPVTAPFTGPPAAAQNGGVQPTTGSFAGSSLSQQTAPGIGMPRGQLPAGSSTRREIGKFGGMTLMKPVTVIHRTSTVSRGTGPMSPTGGGGSNTVPVSNPVAAGASNPFAAGASNPAVDVNVGVDAPAAQQTNVIAGISKRAGIIDGMAPPNLDLKPGQGRNLPVFNSRKGLIITNGDPSTWPSINPESRINAVFLPDKYNDSGTIPGPEVVRVYEPNPVNVTTLPAASFETGEQHCSPEF